MAIDGIRGTAPGLSGVAPSVGPTSTAPAGEATTPELSRVGGSGQPLLERLQRGELDREGFLEAHVEQAVQPFVGRLSGERLQTMREVLRAQLAVDPLLQELVRQATGSDQGPRSQSGRDDGLR